MTEELSRVIAVVAELNKKIEKLESRVAELDSACVFLLSELRTETTFRLSNIESDYRALIRGTQEGFIRTNYELTGLKMLQGLDETGNVLNDDEKPTLDGKPLDGSESQ